MRRQLSLLLLLAGPLAAADLEPGLEAYRRGDHATAVRLLTGAVEADPTLLAARYWRGAALSAQGLLAAALEDFAAVLAAKPDSIPTRYSLAQALEAVGRQAEALAEYRLILSQQPNHAEAAAAATRLADLVRTTPTAAVALTRPPAARLGPHLGLRTVGLDEAFPSALDEARLGAASPQLLDYTFGSAPTDWEPQSGLWQISSRFACDPSWSFYGGHSRGLAMLWNKRTFAGNQIVEAYVSFKHGLPWNARTWSYRPADLCLTLCGDGANPQSGYTFIYSGNQASETLIRRGDQVLASTSDPRFLTPSYSDLRPESEDFHRRWWRLEAQLVDGRLAFYIDGQLACEAVDPNPLPSGRLALWTVNNGMMVARVRVAYQQELRRLEPLVRVAEPAPLPAPPPTS